MKSGQVFIRSKHIIGEGAQKEFRDLLIIDSDNRFLQAAEYRLLKRKRKGRDKRIEYSDLKREDDFLRGKQFGDHVVCGSLYRTKKQKGDIEKLSFIVPRADDISDLTTWQTQHKKDSDYASKMLVHLRDMALGLKEMHDKNIVHCDIKPEQAMLFDGKVKLGDLGFSVESNGGKARDSLGGTREYMPFEIQSRGVQDKAQDLFSFGCILGEVYKGRFKGQLTETQKKAFKQLKQKLLTRMDQSMNYTEISKQRGSADDLVNVLNQIIGEPPSGGAGAAAGGAGRPGT